MACVRDVLRHKGPTVLSIGPAATVYEAIEMMERHRVGSLVVIDGAGRLAGMLTERDYLRKVALHGRSDRTTRVSEIMTPEVTTAAPDDDVEACLQVMTRKRFRHLPVLDARGGVVGIVSIGDLVKAVVEDQQVELHHLHTYIRGGDVT